MGMALAAEQMATFIGTLHGFGMGWLYVEKGAWVAMATAVQTQFNNM